MKSIWVNANHCGKQWNLAGSMQTIVAGNGIYLGELKPLWRGDLSPLGCEAAPKPQHAVSQAELWWLDWGC
ncbi:hypothetical protein, partial [Pseudomonas sp. PS01303]|uniref:hypothetical protein n=1 Tax=Pseudomonas sp. PS01303 TaxID=2991439 RepID=UPI00249A7EFB